MQLRYAYLEKPEKSTINLIALSYKSALWETMCGWSFVSKETMKSQVSFPRPDLTFPIIRFAPIWKYLPSRANVLLATDARYIGKIIKLQFRSL